MIMSAKKEVEQSIVMPLVNIPYKFVEAAPAESRAEQLERKKDDLQSRLDAALKV